MPKPSTFLTKFFVAGVQFRLSPSDIRNLDPGPVTLELEPTNPYDPNAIKVIGTLGPEDPAEEPYPIHLGYVPAKNGTNLTIIDEVRAGLAEASLVLIDPDARLHEALGVEVHKRKEDPSRP